MTGQMPRLRAASRFALESYPLSVIAAWRDVGSDIEENLEIATITGFAASQMKECLQKLAVVPALVAAPRARRPEYLQDERPVGFRHGREHGRSSSNRPPMSHRKTDSGIPPRYTRSNPSTRPSASDRYS